MTETSDITISTDDVLSWFNKPNPLYLQVTFWKHDGTILSILGWLISHDDNAIVLQPSKIYDALASTITISLENVSEYRIEPEVETESK